jgi:hypothetical protein
MTIDEQISLIDAMIAENPDYTIRDFFDLMKEVKSVSDSMEIKCHHFIFHQINKEHGQIFSAYYRKTLASLRFYGR